MRVLQDVLQRSRVAPAHCCTEAPSDPYVSLVATYGSSKPCSDSGCCVVPDRLSGPPALVAVTILPPHPLCVVLVDTSTSDVPVVDHVLRSVHPSQVSNLPLGSSGVGASSSQAHLPTSACFHSRAPDPVSGRLYEKRPG
jgi:hypothetical protein